MVLTRQLLRFATGAMFALWCSLAIADTWSFGSRRSLPNVPEDEFVRQVRFAMATFGRYFTRDFREVASGGNVRVTVAGNANTAYYDRGTIVFGGRVSAGASGPLRGIHADFVRRTVLHEMFHHLIPSINFHTWQTQLRGNRVVDIGGSWDSLTEYDGAMLVRYAGFQWRGDLRPWDASEDRWWLTRYAWTNPTNPYDVNDDRRVSALDALSVINAVGQGVRFDEFTEPRMFFDVNSDRQVTAADAIAVINRL